MVMSSLRGGIAVRFASGVVAGVWLLVPAPPARSQPPPAAAAVSVSWDTLTDTTVRYGLTPVPGLTVRPNIQYVYTPGASSSNVNILVLGLKTVINF